MATSQNQAILILYLRRVDDEVDSDVGPSMLLTEAG